MLSLLGPDFFRLARVLQALLGATVVMYVVLLVADWYYLGLAQRLIDTRRGADPDADVGVSAS